jgi:hypothetical protein
LVPVQTPAWHESVRVQAFPSLHVVPAGAAGLEQAPEEVSHVPATWQASWAVHTRRLVPVHVPDWQESVCVQPLPSLHVVPSGATGLEQAPEEVSHVPATWQASWAVHTTGLSPLHTPTWHESLCVQALPSLHLVPSGATGLEQVPEAGSHAPGSRQTPCGAHTTGLAPVQTPDWQESVRVHALPSLQMVPSWAGGLEHAPEARSHVPATWQTSWAVHTTGLAPLQTPVWQESVRVHALPSLQVVPSLALASTGQTAELPSHTSATSQSLAAGRQTVAADATEQTPLALAPAATLQA